LKTIIFICCNFAYLAIINTISGRPFKNYQFVWLFLIGLWMLAIPFSQNSALKVWLYYLPNQLFLIYLGCYALYQLRIDPLSALAKKYLRFIGWLSIGFGVAILLEDTFVIFNIDQYSDIVFKINNRNVSEDIYTIILSIAIIYFCNRDFPLSVLEKDAAKLEENQSDEPVLLAPFCDAYQLTQREREVLSLLLECKTNQDIANELFLSIGTVKTHIHNIFVKLEVNKRAEVFVSYQLFSQQQTEHLAR
ncbi:helix-turn-helix domain-containing protein, partial [Enterococcus faecalis]